MRSRLIMVGVILVVLVGIVAVVITTSRNTPPLPTATPASDLKTIQAQIDAGQYADAAPLLEAFLAQNPENAEAQFLAGLTYFQLGDYGKAEAAFRRTLELDPSRAAAVHHNLGVLAYQMNQLDQAVTEFKAALEADPEDPDTHYQLGAAYLVMALPAESLTPDTALVEQAAAEFQRALELSPDKPEALIGLGNAYLLQNQLPEAVQALEQAVQVAPQMSEALFALGRAYAAAGQYDQARQTLQRFLETNPPEVWAQQANEMLSQLPQQ